MENDEGIWSYVGLAWVDYDAVPYKGTVENKTPGIFLLNALSYCLFGVNFIFTRLIGLFTILISSYLIYKIGKTIRSKLSGFLAALLFFNSTTWNIVNGPYLAHSEIFMIFFNICSFFLILKNKNRSSFSILAIGFVVGLAISFKQIAVLTLGGLILFMIYQFKCETYITFKKLSVLLLGALIASSITVLPILLSGGSISSYIEGAWLILLNDGSHYPISAQRAMIFLEIFFNSKLAFFLPIVFFMIFFFKSLFIDLNSKILFIWLIIAFIGTNASGYYFGHQITQLLPPLSLCSGLTITKLSHKRKITRNIFLALLLMLFTFPYKTFLHNISEIIKSEKPILSSVKATTSCQSQSCEVGKWVKKQTSKKDKIYFYGKSFNTVAAYAQRQSASKYFNNFFLTNPNIVNTVKKGIKSNRPKFIIKEKRVKERNFIEKILENHYKQEMETKKLSVFKKN
jgi:4-amino-4-deoxy-L-arabinose transferase-like glycosyltransferase